MKLLFTATVLLISEIAFSQGKTYSLKECIEAGIANHVSVQQSKLQTDVSQIDLQQAKLNRLPTVNGSISQGVNFGRSIDPVSNAFINQRVGFGSYGANGNLVLFSGRRLDNTIKQNALTYEATKAEQQQTEDDLTINIILAYLQVLTMEEILAQSRNQAELTRRQSERLEIMNKEGAISPPLLYDLKGHYASDQLQIIDNENLLQAAKLDLSQLMNMPYDKHMQVEKLPVQAFAGNYDQTPATVRDAAFKQFARVVAADLRRKSAERSVKAAKGALYPTLSLYANGNTNYSSVAAQESVVSTVDVPSGDYVFLNGVQTEVFTKQRNFQSQRIAYGTQLNNNLFNSVGLNLSVPIFNGFRARNNIKLAKISVKANEYAVQTVKNDLSKAIELAFINLESAQKRYLTVTEQQTSFTESFRAAEARFALGVGTSVDYLTAKNNLDRASINLISAKYDFVLRSKLLDYYRGEKLW